MTNEVTLEATELPQTIQVFGKGEGISFQLRVGKTTYRVVLQTSHGHALLFALNDALREAGQLAVKLGGPQYVTKADPASAIPTQIQLLQDTRGENVILRLIAPTGQQQDIRVPLSQCKELGQGLILATAAQKQ